MNEIYKNRSDNPQPRKPRAVRRIRQPNSCAPSELTGRQVYLDGTAVSPCEPLEPNPPIPPRAPEKDVFTGKKYKPKRDSKIYPRIKKQLPARKSKKAKIIGAVAAFLIFAAAVTVSITKGLKFYKKEMLVRKHPIQYQEIVEKYSGEFGVPAPIVFAVIKTESSFVQDAVSTAGAIGLMQIMPETFEWLQTKTGETLDKELLYTADVNIRYGTFYLSWLKERFGSWKTAWAAYNAGIGRVKGWLEDTRYSDGSELLEIPFGETKAYVERVAENAAIYEELYYQSSDTETNE
ncbi:MAG TPA: lytic transglycosylase domain-containing protein [Clostridiales bacterium]|nr:lytic transglycosylase domain-containing protein [Clostridiales bacterium]